MDDDQALPPRLRQDIAELRKSEPGLRIHPDGSRYLIVLAGFALPAGLYDIATTDLLLMADYQYPQSAMDMFWTDPTVHGANGQFPQNADQFETYGDRRWQRWSWHYPGWAPSRHSVATHLEVVRDRLQRGC